MVLVQRRCRHHLLFVLIGMAGCGGGAEVVVTVQVPEGQGALTGVTQVDFSVSHASRRIAFISEAYKSGESLTFDHLPHDNDMTIGLVGRDATGTPLVFGSTTTGTIGEIDCCVTLCLCSAALTNSGGCSCGTSGCNACGTPRSIGTIP